MNDDTVPMGCESAMRYLLQRDGQIDPPPVSARYIGRRHYVPESRVDWPGVLIVVGVVLLVALAYVVAAANDAGVLP